MDKVGGLADTCGGQSTDTAFLLGNGAEGGVAVEPEAVFHGWPQARRECLPGGTQWSGSRAGATCRSGWNQAFLLERQAEEEGIDRFVVIFKEMGMNNFQFLLYVSGCIVRSMSDLQYFKIPNKFVREIGIFS